MNTADEIKRLRERLDNQISLREFGAVLDGATDDLLRINAMVTTLGSLAVTLLVTGPCYVSANVTIPANILVRFEGAGAFAGPGAVTFTRWGPPTLSAIYNTNVMQVLTNGASTIVNFDTKEVDTDNAVTIGGAWHFTVPAGRAGIYKVAATVSFLGPSAGGGTTCFIGIFKNGVETKRGDRMMAQVALGTTTLYVNVSADLLLAAGDAIDIRAFQNMGTFTLEGYTPSNYVSIRQ